MRYLALSALCIAACSHLEIYDSPSRSREMMTLGSIDVAVNDERVFRVRELRRGDIYVLGFYQVAGDCSLQSSSRRVTIVVTNELGEEVIKTNSTLAEMKWSKGRDHCLPAFGYLRGEVKSKPIQGSDDVCNEPISSGAEHGYGTQFVPQRTAHQYEVSIRTYNQPSVGTSAIPLQVVLANDGPWQVKRCE